MAVGPIASGQAALAIAALPNATASDPTETLVTLPWPEGERSLAQTPPLPASALALPNFDPQRDTFQFTNGEMSRTIGAAIAQEQWQQEMTRRLQELFGTQVCVGFDGSRCVLTAAAQNWLDSQLELMNQGVCDGMAAANLFLWQPTQQPPRPWWQRLLGFVLQQTIYQLTRNIFDIQTFIANLFLLQGVDEVYQPTQRIREGFSPVQILSEIINAIRSNPQDPYTMGIYRIRDGNLVEGHTLTPYRVEPKQGGKQYWVYVYDTNYPFGRSQADAPYVVFDVQANTWVYQPSSTDVAFQGNAQTKNLDLTKLSWRSVKPQEGAPSPQGPFTCPFCGSDRAPTEISGIPETPDTPEVPEAPPPQVEITLVGEGTMTVEPLDGTPQADLASSRESGGAEQIANWVPFRGGLNRDVPATYQHPLEEITKPLKVTLTGAASTPTGTPTSATALHVTGPGYTAAFEDLRLNPQQTLTLYVFPKATGPELTFVAPTDTTIPKLAVYLEDFTTETTETLATPEGEVPKEIFRTKDVSYSFNISDLQLPAGKAVAVGVNRAQKRFYFGDNDSEPNTYRLYIEGQTREEEVTTSSVRTDFPDGTFEIAERKERRTLRYFESLTVPRVSVAGDSQGHFDYGNWAVAPTFGQGAIALEAEVNVPIGSSPRAIGNAAANFPVVLATSQDVPSAERVYRGYLLKSNNQ